MKVLLDCEEIQLVLKNIIINGKELECFWLGIHKTPDEQRIKNITRSIMNEIPNLRGRAILHAEHVSSEALRLPSPDEFKFIAATLENERENVRNFVQCTVIQTRSMDPMLEMAKNLFLVMYTPIRPFFIGKGPQETIEFLEKIII